MKLKLWLISQNENNGYEVYDSAVVAAKSELSARTIHPDTGRTGPDNKRSDVWVGNPESVSAKCIGEASPEIKNGEIICASFNAG